MTYDSFGNELSGTDENGLVSQTSYDPQTGEETETVTVTRNYQGRKWLPAYETQTISTYDDNGNVSRTETRSRKEGETEWQSQTVRTDYDEQGRVTKE